MSQRSSFINQPVLKQYKELLVQGAFITIRLCTSASSYVVWSPLALLYSADRMSPISILLVHKCLPALTVVRPQEPGAHSGHVPHSHCLHKAGYIQMSATIQSQDRVPTAQLPPSPPARLSI